MISPRKILPYTRLVYKRSVPFGQAVRFKRILSNEDSVIQRHNGLMSTKDINQKNKT